MGGITVKHVGSRCMIYLYFEILCEPRFFHNNNIIIHAFIKRRNPTCRSKALNNDVAEVTCKAN